MFRLCAPFLHLACTMCCICVAVRARRRAMRRRNTGVTASTTASTRSVAWLAPSTSPSSRRRSTRSPPSDWLPTTCAARSVSHRTQDYFTIKGLFSIGKLDRRRDVTKGNPLRPSEWGFKIGYFPNIYGNFCTFSCFSLDTEDQIFQ